jgi:DNA-binding response OmpR family regulator
MRILVLSDHPDSASELAKQVYQEQNEYTINTTSWPSFSPTLLDNMDLLLIYVRNIIDCRQVVKLRRITTLPILVVSPIEDEELLASLYAVGVDDHLALPVSYPLLLAKLRVWQRWIVRFSNAIFH